MTQPPTPLRLLAVHACGIAQGYAAAGTVEVNDNRGEQIEFFQQCVSIPPGSSWCAAFVYACLLKAWTQQNGLLIGATADDNRRIMLAHADEFSRLTHIPRTGYCPTVADAAKKQGRFHTSGFDPLPGDLVLYDFERQGQPHHIGFVIAANADGTLRTCEGNTVVGAVGSQANGGGVYVKTRGRGSVFGFVAFR